MKVLDLNLLIYAVNRDSGFHARARSWLEATLSGDEPVGIPWAVILGFLRIATSDRVLPKPLKPDQGLTIVTGWLAQPAVFALSPGDGHWTTLRRLLDEAGTAGNLTTDAHLAALAIENGAELCSTDSDFARFPNLRWMNPLAR
jgi:toxin-antitoxin system PIN domain toxin